MGQRHPVTAHEAGRGIWAEEEVCFGSYTPPFGFEVNRHTIRVYDGRAGWRRRCLAVAAHELTHVAQFVFRCGCDMGVSARSRARWDNLDDDAAEVWPLRVEGFVARLLRIGEEKG